MFDLLDVAGEMRRVELYELGVAMSLGVNDPKQLPDLLKAPDAPTVKDSVQGMLKPTKKIMSRRG